ncbi:MAG: PAS domain-containing protein [Vicinamibacterales bacterium]
MVICDRPGCTGEKEELGRSLAELESRVGELTKELEYVQAALNEHAMVAFTDRRGTILSVNDRFCTISQYSREELVGQDHCIINSGHHSKEFMRSLWTTITSGQVWKGEIKNRAKDGSFYWVDTTIVPLLDDSGNPTRFVAIRNDITERKRAEEVIRDSAEQFQTMANSIPALAWVARGDGYIFWYNRRWHEYTGTTADQMEGWGWQRVHDPEVLPRVLERWTASIASGEPFEMEFPLRGADGTFRPFLTRVLPLKDETGRVVRWFGTNTDISPLKQSEEILLERLRLATRAGRVAVWDWDVIQNRLQWDDAMYELYGVSREQFSGAYEAWAQGLHPDDAVRMHEEIRLALSGERAYDTTFRVRLPDRSVRYIQANATVLRDASGAATRMLGTNWDITSRKRAEEELLASLQEKKVLLKEIHHRVKNNLQIVSTLLDLQSGYTRDPATLAMFQESRGRVKSMALIHERLYRSEDLSRVDFARYTRQLVDDLYRAYNVSHEDVRLELDIDIPELGIDVAIPCGLLLNELITNSLKYAFADAAAGRLRVGLQRAGDVNVLTVADTGIGFPATIDFRNTSSFGLQLVNTLVEQLDGEIVLADGPGTTFTVRFPTPAQQRH